MNSYNIKGIYLNLYQKQQVKKLDTIGVQKRGGDYIESELQKHINTEDNNMSVCNEIIQKGRG